MRTRCTSWRTRASPRAIDSMTSSVSSTRCRPDRPTVDHRVRGSGRHRRHRRGRGTRVAGSHRRTPRSGTRRQSPTHLRSGARSPRTARDAVCIFREFPVLDEAAGKEELARERAAGPFQEQNLIVVLGIDNARQRKKRRAEVRMGRAEYVVSHERSLVVPPHEYQSRCPPNCSPSFPGPDVENRSAASTSG